MNQSYITLLIPRFRQSYELLNGSSKTTASQATASSMLDWSGDQAHLPWQEQLNRLLGLAQSDGHSSFTARLLNPGSAEPLVCADPVHLQADRDTATMVAPETLRLSDEEADSLTATLNEFLLVDGLRFRVHSPTSWFLSGMPGSHLESLPPSFLANRPVSSYLPEGEDTEQWRRLMSEIQMLLHGHPVNLERERQGKPTVNCVWFWGGADLPDLSEKSGLMGEESTVIYADDEYSQRLAEYLGLTIRSLGQFGADLEAIQRSNSGPLQRRPADAHASHPHKPGVIVVDTRLSAVAATADEAALARVLHDIESESFPALHSGVESGLICSVLYLDEDGGIGKLDQSSIAAHLASQRSGRIRGAIGSVLYRLRQLKRGNGIQRLAERIRRLS